MYFFLNCVGVQFDYYDDCCIPLKQWIDALGVWKKYAESDDFDQVLEEMAGIDYTRHTVARPDQAKYMCDGGGKMWIERKIKKSMIDGLMEWTNKYKDSYDCIYCCF